jgi:DNA-binding NarL/FixJ family response regulator
MERTRVLLAEDHAAVAKHLRRILEQEFDVVGVVEDGQGPRRRGGELSPDVIITDIGMPGLDGVAAATRILQRNGAARIVFVTDYNDPFLVQLSLVTGALGYVLKLTAGDELVPAVHAALRGERHVTKRVGRTPRSPEPEEI